MDITKGSAYMQRLSDETDPMSSSCTSHDSEYSVILNNETANSTDDASVIYRNTQLAMLPAEVVEEEKKSILEREEEIKTLNNQNNVLENKEKEKRFKDLMSLLGKSNQYAIYMAKKLVKEKENFPQELVKNNVPQKTQKGTRKRKATFESKGNAKKFMNNNKESIEIPNSCYKNKLGLIVSKRQPTLLVGAVMRDYQLDGLEWLVALYKSAVNGILADEMGLGKTIQIISLICHLREKGIYGPHVIIAPLSTLPNWMLEFANFAPDIPVMLMHGTETERKEKKIAFAKMVKEGKTKIPIILTSYEIPLRENKFFTSVSWCFTIVDEGHRLKNHNSLLSQKLRSYQTESRLLLTGTPLQNNLTELWSLLNYLIPEIFDDLPMFENVFDFSNLIDSEKQNQLIKKEKEEQLVSKMHQILEPFLLRRLKSDVNIELPRKKELLVYAPLTPMQENLYKKVLDRSILYEVSSNREPEVVTGKRKCRTTFNYSDLGEWNEDYYSIGKEGHNIASAEKVTEVLSKTGRKDEEDGQFIYHIKYRNITMMLRKIVNHPHLVKTPVIPGTNFPLIDEKLISDSGKLLVLDAILPKLKSQNHKVLLFSTFTMMLDLVEEYVLMKNYKYVRLDGSYSIEERLDGIKQFNSDPETFIFLISTRAGGLGINLTAADTVIIYDSDWNPQVDLQAQDRCHRIGQTRPVVVYRLVSAGTVDQRIVDVAVSKRKLEKLVVKNGKFNFGGNKEAISLNELQELLKSTDYKKVIHSNGLVFTDKEIDELLDRSDLLGDTREETTKQGGKIFKVV